MQTTTSNSNLYEPQIRGSVASTFNQNDNHQIDITGDLFSINNTVGQFGIQNRKGYHRQWHSGKPLALDTYKKENLDLKTEPELASVSPLGYVTKSPAHGDTQSSSISTSHPQFYAKGQSDVTKSQLDGFKDLTSSPPIYTSKNTKSSGTQDDLPSELSSERTPSPATSLSAAYTETERGANYNNLYSQEGSSFASSLSSEEQSILEEDKRAIYR